MSKRQCGTAAAAATADAAAVKETLGRAATDGRADSTWKITDKFMCLQLNSKADNYLR